MNKYKSILLGTLIIIISVFVLNQKPANAEEKTVNTLQKFNCDSTFYAITARDEEAPSEFLYYKILENGSLQYTPKKSDLPTMNAMGYRFQDNYIYAIGRNNTNRNHLYKIDAEGNYNDLGKLNGINDSYINLAGSFLPNGKFYVMNGELDKNIMWEIDVDPKSNLYKQAVPITLSTPLNKAYDFAYNANDGLLYGYESNTPGQSDGGVFSIRIVYKDGNPRGGEVDRLRHIYPYTEMGATWVFGDSLFGYENDSGLIYEFYIGNNENKRGRLSANAPLNTFKIVGQNDGMNCPNAPNPFLHYPWLQTSRGDVTSLDKIIGQDINVGGPTTETRGAKHTTTNIKYDPAEAEFVVVSQNNGNNFCSGKLYVLAKNETDRKNCDTGGYSSVGVNFGEIDEALQNTWAKNGSGVTDNPSINPTACKPYNTKYGGAGEVTLTDYDASIDCAGGGLTKLGANYPAQPTVLKVNGNITGKGTLWVDGDLIIKSDIKYATNGVGSNLANLPNLAIYATGKITIAENVTQIDAMLVSKSQIITCDSSDSLDAGKCASKLTVYGLFASYDKIDFGRRYNVQNDPNKNPAEQLILTAQSIMLPPPGFSKSDGDTNSQLQFNSSELSPRLN